MWWLTVLLLTPPAETGCVQYQIWTQSDDGITQRAADQIRSYFDGAASHQEEANCRTEYLLLAGYATDNSDDDHATISVELYQDVAMTTPPIKSYDVRCNLHQKNCGEAVHKILNQ